MNVAMPIFIEQLLAASTSILAQAESAFQEAQQRKEQDIASAIKDRSGLADGYWKASHAARLRYETAKGFCEALHEISVER